MNASTPGGQEAALQPASVGALGDDTILSLRHAAAALGVSRMTVIRLSDRGILHKLRISPGRVGIRLGDVRAYVASLAKDKT